MDRLKEIAVIWSAETRRAVRSGRVVVLLGIYTLVTLLVLLGVGTCTSAANSQLEQAGANAAQASSQMVQWKKDFLGLVSGGDTLMVEALAPVPLVVLVVFMASLFFLPGYVAMMGFDQLSGEVGPHSIRYLTVRARRASVLLGKFLVQASLLVGLVLIIDLGIFLYARLTHSDFALALMAVNLVKFWLAAIVFSLAFVALTTFCSSLFRTPALSLVFNFSLLLVFLLLWVYGMSRKNEPLGSVRFLSPFAYWGDLLNPQLAAFGLNGLAYVGFTALFLGAAYAVLRARDL